MDVQNLNAVDREHGAMLKSALTGDKEALGWLLSSLSDQLYCAAFRVLASHEEAKTRYRTACLPRPEM
jgi:hypothetical protein